jgi:hypothetical protein
MSLKVDVEDSGTRYENTRPGYGLPTHEHALHDDCHTVEVIEGAVVVFFDHDAFVLKAGEVYSGLDVAQRHGIWPIGHAVWFNRRYGLSDFIRNMPEEEKHTELEHRVDLPRWVRSKLNLE